MSELRKVKINFDPEIVRKTADKLGYEVFERKKIDSYATREFIGDIVVKKGYIEFGFIGNEVIYDNMFSEHVGEFVANYVALQLEERGLNPHITKTRDYYTVIVVR